MIKQPICATVTCDVCDYVFDEDDDGIVHFATAEIALECVRNAGWWATETAILCNGGEGIEHAAKAAEIAERIEAGDPDGKRTAEFLTWCEKTGYEIDAEAAPAASAARAGRDPGGVLVSAIDLKSFDSVSALIDACLDAMPAMTEHQRASLRTEILAEFGLPTMMAISTVHLIERQHAQRLREAFGENSAQRVLQQLRSECLRAVLDARVSEGAESGTQVDADFGEEPVDITAVRTLLYHDGAEHLRQSRHYYKLMCQNAGLAVRGERAEFGEPGEVAASMYAALASAVTFQWAVSAILRFLEQESPEIAQKVAGIVELVQDVGIEAIEDANDDLPEPVAAEAVAR